MSLAASREQIESTMRAAMYKLKGVYGGDTNSSDNNAKKNRLGRGHGKTYSLDLIEGNNSLVYETDVNYSIEFISV